MTHSFAPLWPGIKLYGSLLLAVALTTACGTPEPKENKTGVEFGITSDSTARPVAQPAFGFETDQFDFGRIIQGEKVSFSFRFKNTGKAPLIISDARATCGCTVPDWPREPIAPGEGGLIKVVYDSQGKMGTQSKTITLVANTVPNTYVLTLKGEVYVP